MTGDLFSQKAITPMLIGANLNAFDDSDWIFEIKLDGVRGLAYLDPQDGTELRNKRNIRCNDTYPELSGLHRHVKGRCILDGEWYCVDANGKPDFGRIQSRSIMTDQTRIQFAMRHSPVMMCAYDILYLDGEQLTERPLMERKAILTDVVREDDRLTVSRYIERHGSALYGLAVQEELEGVVAKRKDSRYYAGTTTKKWARVKYLKDADFVVCGYIPKDAGKTSLVLGQYDGGALTYQGHVTLGVSSAVMGRVRAVEPGTCPFAEMPPRHEAATWLAPVLVCVVRFMPRGESTTTQRVFKGLRDDKEPRACTTGQEEIE